MNFLALISCLTQFYIITAITPYTSQPNVCQDKYLNENFFKNMRNGVFVDIGAHDGKSFSNSYFFEKELGWTGICFEPLTEPFKKLEQNRKCICINSCVSDIEGKVQFIEVDHAAISPDVHEYSNNMLSGMLHTYHPKHMERLLRILNVTPGCSYKIVTLPSRTFNNVMKENKISHIDYLSMDTEGGEFDILQSIDFDSFYICAISVENNYKESRIKTLLTSKGFVYITNLDQDEIYINSTSKLYKNLTTQTILR